MIPPLAALFSWPIVSLVLFNQRSVQTAIVVTIIGAFLLLPAGQGLSLPMLPTLTKSTIPSIAAILFALALASNKGLIGLIPRGVVPISLLLLLLVGGVVTNLTNGDPVQTGPRYLPGLRVHDALALVINLILMLIPLLLARKFLADRQGHRTVLIVIAVAAVAYAPLTWIELRMSPQMNNWIYGYFPHQWAQHVRATGFRPVVFTGHGLLLSLYLSAAVLSAAALCRVLPDKRGKALVALGLISITLVLSKSLGPLLITVILVPFVLFCGVRLQLMAAAVISVLFLLYPVSRAAGIVPVDQIEQAVAQHSEQRAHSLGVRLENEDTLLARANERPIFGWGGWGRSRVLDEFGRDITIADGRWVIVFGLGGWVRYIGEFGLLAMPAILLLFRARSLKPDLETAALALILAGNLIDLIPNSSATPMTWLIAGALWGRLELKNSEADPPDGALADGEPAPKANTYTRQTERITRIRATPPPRRSRR